MKKIEIKVQTVKKWLKEADLESDRTGEYWMRVCARIFTKHVNLILISQGKK